MIKMTPLDGDYEFFSAETFEDIILLRFKENLLVRATDLDTKDTLFNFIGRISSQVDIKVVVIINSPQKTGIGFFLSKMLGRTTAYDIMLSDEDMSAQEALKLGIVNEVVPLEKLEEISLDRARRFARKPSSALQGVKRLLRYSLKDLQDYLNFENEVLIRIIKSPEFHKCC